MPSKTFFNLPANKRDRLIEIAIEEFANKDYNSASISQIVRKTGIAQGSLYQYFANKKELYLYLLNLLMETKVAFLQSDRESQTPRDFFTYLTWIFERNLEFDCAYPALSKLGYRAFYSEPPFLEVEQIKQASQQFMHQLVTMAIEQGDINSKIDRDLAVFLIDTLIGAIPHYLPQKLGISQEQLVIEGANSFDTLSAKSVFQDLVEVLKYGLAKHQK